MASPAPTLRQRVLLSGSAIGASTAIQYAAAIGSQIILARYLDPDAFGQFAFILLVHGMVCNLRSLNGGEYLVAYRGEDVHRAYSTIFSLDLLVTGVTTVITILLATPIMELVHRPDLATPYRWMALALPLISLSLPLAMAQRRIDFVNASLPGTIGILVSPFVKVFLAMMGFGVYALVWGELLRQGLVTVLIWYFCPERPSLLLDRKLVRDSVAFGIPTTLAGLMVYYYWKVDDFFVSRYLGLEALGFYYLAFRIPEYMFNLKLALGPLVYASLCQLPTEDKQREGFLIATHLTAVVTGLPVAMALVVGGPLITTVFGARWHPAILAFQILMLATSLRMTFGYLADLLKSRGRTWILPGFTSLNAVCLSLGAWYLTPRFGIEGTAAAVLLTVIVSVIPTVMVSRRIVDVNPLAPAIRPTLVLAASVAAGWALGAALPRSLPWQVVIAFVTCFTYIGATALFDPQAIARIERVTGLRLMAPAVACPEPAA